MKYSKVSEARLEQCHRDLQKLFNEVIKHVDCTILTGHRAELEQDKAFNEGKSKLKYPHSKHNSWPSKAIDVAPYPIDWKDQSRFIHFAGFVRGLAASMNIPLRWGGDWNKNFIIKDENFRDLVHFELGD